MDYAGSEKFYKLGYNAALNDVESMILTLISENFSDNYSGKGGDLLLILFDQISNTIKQSRESNNDRRSK